MTNTQEIEHLFYGIEFKNCGLEYDFTICETLDEVQAYLQMVDKDGI